MASEWTNSAISAVADVTDFVANGSFEALRNNVTYRNEPDYAVLVRLVDHNAGWNGDYVYVDKPSFDFLRKSSLSPGDAVIANVGANAGTVFRVPKLDRPMTLGPNAVVCRPKDPSVLNRDYLFHFLKGPQGQESIRSILSGSAQPKFNKTDFRSLQIPLPPLPEQKAIARILGTLDDKIELNRRMNATLEAMARALFQSWFVDFDPVHAKAAGRPPSGMDAPTAALFPDSFQDSAIGEIPDGWDAVTLGSVLDVLETGRRPKGGVSGFTSGIPSIGAESIWGIGEFDFGKTKFVPEEFFAKMSSGKVQHLDVLLYKDGGKPGEFRPRVGMFGHDFPFEEFGINEHVFRLRSSSVGQLYLYYSVADPRVLLDFANKGGKAAIPGINQQDVRSTVILHPPHSILEKFDRIVAPLVDRMLRNAKESRTLATLRDALLPKLLSGAIAPLNHAL